MSPPQGGTECLNPGLGGVGQVRAQASELRETLGVLDTWSSAPPSGVPQLTPRPSPAHTW